MKTKKLLGLACLMLISLLSKAQEANTNPLDTLTTSVIRLQSDFDVLRRVKISGYLQPQFQYIDSPGAGSYAGGNFNANVDKRFAMRRGRVKVAYETELSSYVFQIEMSEKGMTIKDCYARITEPWLKTVSLTAGMMNRPFGYEIGYSSSLRESPERGRMSQIIFPGERDLGAMITIQTPKGTNWNFLKLDAGMYNGTGGPSAGINASDFDIQKDFITHLSANKSTKNEKISYGIGLSYYDGGFRQGSKNLYRMNGDTSFTALSDTANYGKIAHRQYYGADAQLNIQTPIGITTLRGEYIFGRQPGTSSTSASPVAQPTADCYVRDFNGAYFYFIQNIASSKHQLLVKYDWYDPNVKVSGDQIGKYKIGAADLKYTTLGIGWAYRWDTNVKITAYYDMVTNETTTNLKGYDKDLKDNVVTLRVQYKF